jgi:hypothetical protein
MKLTWYKGHLLTLDGDGPTFEVETSTHVIIFATAESAKERIDEMSIIEHVWLNGDLRELARSIQENKGLPHPVERCAICSEATILKLVLIKQADDGERIDRNLVQGIPNRI